MEILRIPAPFFAYADISPNRGITRPYRIMLWAFIAAKGQHEP